MSRWLLLLCAGMVLACSDATGFDFAVERQIRTELARNEAKWSAQGITDYRYAFRRVCDCPPETTAAVGIEVRDGSMFRVRLLATGSDISTGSAFWPTVDDLFAEIRLALHEGAAGIQVRYDPVYGYPLEIAIQWSTRTSGTIAHYASELTPIE